MNFITSSANVRHIRAKFTMFCSNLSGEYAVIGLRLSGG